MHPIRAPQTKAGLQWQQKQQKAHIHMEAEQRSLNDDLVKGEIKKEINDLKWRYNIPKLTGHNESSAKRKTHSSKYLQKETGESLH